MPKCVRKSKVMIAVVVVMDDTIPYMYIPAEHREVESRSGSNSGFIGRITNIKPMIQYNSPLPLY